MAPFDPNQDFKTFLEKFKREFQRVLKLSIELEKKLNEEAKEKSVLETYITSLKSQLSIETQARETLEHQLKDLEQVFTNFSFNRKVLFRDSRK